MNDKLTEEEFLKQYDADVYKKPSVTVDMLIFTIMDKEESNYRKLPEKSLKILMVKRKNHPFIGKWALPGGFVSIDESLDDAAARVLKNETNVNNVYMEQLYTWGDVDRDKRTRVISVSYLALVDSSALSLIPGNDEEDARWFTVSYKVIEDNKIELKLNNNDEELSSNSIAFDHGKIIEYAIDRLKNKISYTDIALNLMPELFTLTELQQVYQLIEGREILAAAFRRKISNMVIETNEYTKDVGHRPSKLYKKAIF